MTRTGLAVAGLAALLVAAAPADAQISRQSWTADRREFTTGDAITVMIDEHTLAAVNQGDFASDRRFRDMSAQAGGGAIAGVGADVSTGNQAESRRSGESTRQNRFQGEMTVRVVEIEGNGLLRVEGRKVVNIDRNTEELVLRGFVRPQDVSVSNTVDSWRISDAELVYTSDGPNRSPRSGIIGRLLGMIWP